MSSRRTRDSKLGTEKVRQLVPVLLAWFAANARDLPWRRTRDPYAIWVSEIMLQQTQVKTVIPYWERWLRELPTIQSAARASTAKLHKLWEGLGYYTRVRNLQKAAQQIVAQHNGRFPENFDNILALPGIGRYTAGAIASIAFNQPRPILDGNVIRVLARIFGIKTNPREKETNARLWHLAEELVTHVHERWGERPRKPGVGSKVTVARRDSRPTNACSHLNQSLMELGALICTPRVPQCDICPVRRLCVASVKGWQEKLPKPGKRHDATERHFIAFVIERAGKFLVRQRPAGIVNAHLWEFPNIEVEARKGTARHSVLAATLQTENGAQRTDAPSQPSDFCITAAKPFCTIKHSITRYRITLEAWRGRFGGASSKPPKPSGRWLTPMQLHRLAFTSAHKKILAKVSLNLEAKSTEASR